MGVWGGSRPSSASTQGLAAVRFKFRDARSPARCLAVWLSVCDAHHVGLLRVNSFALPLFSPTHLIDRPTLPLLTLALLSPPRFGQAAAQARTDAGTRGGPPYPPPPPSSSSRGIQGAPLTDSASLASASSSSARGRPSASRDEGQAASASAAPYRYQHHRAGEGQGGPQQGFQGGSSRPSTTGSGGGGASRAGGGGGGRGGGAGAAAGCGGRWASTRFLGCPPCAQLALSVPLLCISSSLLSSPLLSWLLVLGSWPESRISSGPIVSLSLSLSRTHTHTYSSTSGWDTPDGSLAESAGSAALTMLVQPELLWVPSNGLHGGVLHSHVRAPLPHTQRPGSAYLREQLHPPRWEYWARD